jgi:predicted  nucleic acid-binding Zn-ribbon protein
MKQILEKLPDAVTLEATFDLLRYENAAQRARIADLEAETETLMETVKNKDAAIAGQQEVIELLTAELCALRDAK